jgi:putative acetyltransferase
MTLSIRREKPGDEHAVYMVNLRAFGRDSEPKIVDVLRKNCPEGISMVAEQDGRIIGHILFTPARIEGEEKGIPGMGLGPMAVFPECQGKGAGSALIRAGLAVVRRTGSLFVAVVGHPRFYPKFGFVPASRYGVRCPYEGVPDDAFMVHAFDPQAFRGVHGIVRMRPEFDSAL